MLITGQPLFVASSNSAGVKVRALVSGRPRAGLGILQHLPVAGGIAERSQRPLADDRINADRLVVEIVVEEKFQPPDQFRLAVLEFVFRVEAGADDAPCRNAVDFLRTGAHEVPAAAGNDERLELVGPHGQ